MRIGAFEVDETIVALREPVAVATLRPWIDAGSAGALALRRLQDCLGARDGGELARPGDFFDFTRYRPTVRYNGDEREFVVPNTRLSYARRRDGRDVLFMDVLEPNMRAEDYLDSIVEVLSAAGAKAHWRLGAWFGGVPHTRPLRVNLSIGGNPADAGTRRRGMPARRYEGPTSIMSLIGPRFAAAGIENNSVMLQIPQYVQIEEDYSAAAAVLEAAGEALGMASELEEAVQGMKARGERQYEKLSRMVAADPELSAAVERLEQVYDAETPAPEPGGRSLPAEIERFLGEVARRMDEGDEER